MVAEHLDPRYVVQHRKSHADFPTEVTQLHGSVSVNDRGAARSLLQFLTMLAREPYPGVGPVHGPADRLDPVRQPTRGCLFG